MYRYQKISSKKFNLLKIHGNLFSYFKNGRKQQQSKTTQVCVVLLGLVYLLGIADTIYVAFRVNNTKTPIDNVIKEINRDVYPREIAEHLQYLNKQLNQLDRYCVACKYSI
jgi:hypothetical protein